MQNTNDAVVKNDDEVNEQQEEVGESESDEMDFEWSKSAILLAPPPHWLESEDDKEIGTDGDN